MIQHTFTLPKYYLAYTNLVLKDKYRLTHINTNNCELVLVINNTIYCIVDEKIDLDKIEAPQFALLDYKWKVIETPDDVGKQFSYKFSVGNSTRIEIDYDKIICSF